MTGNRIKEALRIRNEEMIQEVRDGKQKVNLLDLLRYGNIILIV